jgi:DNA-binding response OmpR family regulator
MKILLLEDDYSYRVSIKEFLESFDYEVDDFENGQDALDAVFENDYALLLLDVRVPTISGHEVVKAVRENDIDVPIIFVTSLTDIEDLSIGYEMGCNDYIRKPFALKELKYRVTQSINSFQFKTSKSHIKLKYNFAYDLDKHELMKDEEYVKLTIVEQRIMQFLIRRLGSFSTTHEMTSTLWDDDFITDADLRMHIKRIRDKTEKNLILNSRGLGYKIEKI